MPAVDVAYLVDAPEEPLAEYMFGDYFEGQTFELVSPGAREVWQEMLKESAMTSYARFLNAFWGKTAGDIQECGGDPFEIARKANRLGDVAEITDAYVDMCRRLLESYLSPTEPYMLDKIPDKWVIAVKQDIEDRLTRYALAKKAETVENQPPPDSD